MNYRIIIIMLLITLLPVAASADVIVLHSGQKVEGRIITKSEDIIVIETPQGRRFQYMATDVKEVLEDDKTSSDTAADYANDGNNTRKVVLRLMFDGGAAFLPMAVGSSRIAGKKIFLGGSVGYAGAYVNGSTHFIPVQAVVAIPLTQRDNSPEIGMSLGYSIGFRDKTAFSGKTGGVTAGLSVGYKWQVGKSNALILGLKTRLIQSTAIQNVTIEGSEYAIEKGVCYITASAGLQVQF